jgi:CRP/FNR family transcriptional regulator, cyclic AMP receptor protein
MAVSNPRPLDLRAASLFDIDPELGELLDARQLVEARSRAIVPVADLTAGPWSPAVIERVKGRPFALMVVDGLVLRELLLAGSTATELLGPGDIVDHDAPDETLLPTETRWSVPEAARVAILDDRLLAIMRTWPGVGRILLDRAARREIRLSTHRAIAQLPRVDQRLLAFFGHLAERWGRVGTAGIVVPMQLTHETLGRLIGARRPTVSLALKELQTDDLLERRDDGSWLLHYDALERLGAESATADAWQSADARPIAVPVVAVDAQGSHMNMTRLRITPEEMRALRERVERLRAEHASQLSRCELTLEYVRAARRARANRRGA